VNARADKRSEPVKLSFVAYHRKRLSIWADQLRVRRDRRRLLRSMPRDADCAEIGVWKGDGTTAILRHTRPRTLVLVDPWESQESLEKARYGKADESAMDETYASVLKRFDTEIAEGRVSVRRARSDQVWGEFGDGALDWVWLDGDHTYEAVTRDLTALARIVKPGGYIIGDDYTYGWWRDGVIRAVDEFVASGNGTLEIIGGIFFRIRL
jgi:hypothetical protein